ncbi:PIR protein [Plasmodium ovale]|uniref:PIR protein n=1 Tax=Plasmodium ovale TaxID=36330 RepID=A0A1D3JFY1_PLAOA|nr:PIR protein [Plasmodium ovale]
MVLENYGFCNYFEQFIENEELLNPERKIEYIPPCALNENDFPENFNRIKNICENFKKLQYTFIEHESPSFIMNQNAKIINFWLNYQLSSLNPPISVEKFFYKMKHRHQTFDAQNKLDNLIYTIDKYDLENMIDIYNMYKIYDKMKNSINTADHQLACSYYSQEIVKIYKKLMLRSAESNNSTFSGALDFFKNKYDYLRTSNGFHNCKIEELPSKPSREEMETLPQSPPRKEFDKLPPKPGREEIETLPQRPPRREHGTLPTRPRHEPREYEYPEYACEEYTLDKVALIKSLLVMFLIAFVIIKLSFFVPWLYNKITGKDMWNSITEKLRELNLAILKPITGETPAQETNA